MNTSLLRHRALKKNVPHYSFLDWLAIMVTIVSIVNYILLKPNIFSIAIFVIVLALSGYIFRVINKNREIRHEEQLQAIKFFLLYGDEWEIMVILNELNQKELQYIIEESVGLFDVSIAKQWSNVGQLLLKHWPPITKTPGGNTELHIVAAFGNSKQFRNALGRCDVTATNASGQTALDVAWVFNQKIVAKTLAAHLARRTGHL